MPGGDAPTPGSRQGVAPTTLISILPRPLRNVKKAILTGMMMAFQSVIAIFAPPVPVLLFGNLWNDKESINVKDLPISSNLATAACMSPFAAVEPRRPRSMPQRIVRTGRKPMT
jgi:hypothetical protein